MIGIAKTNSSIKSNIKPVVSTKSLNKISTKTTTKESKEESKTPEITEATTCYLPEKSMNIAIKEGTAFSVMDGFTSNFITPFAIALNASNTFISILSTLPALIAAFLQLSVTWLLKLYPKRKTWIMIGIFLQAITWLPLVLIPYLIPPEYNYLRVYIIFIAITLNAIFSAIISPIWISMMGDIVPENIRGSYFGKRNAILGVVAFIATFVAGFTLNYISPIIGIIPTFSVMFAIAFFARLVSVYYFNKMEEPKLVIKKVDDSNIFHFLKKIKHNHYGIFVLYLCVLGFAVNIASPFFSVYMLKELHFTYTQFTIITSVSIISSFLTFKIWGKLGDQSGTKNMMIVTGILISFAPLLWVFTTNFILLCVIEAYSGIVWAGFNLSSSNYIYDATEQENRTKNVAYLNILKGFTVFFGALFGGFLTTHIPSFGLSSAILAVFILSTTLRLSTTIFFATKLKEARLIEIRVSKSLFQGSIMICPRQSGFTYNHPLKIENTNHTDFCNPKYDTNKLDKLANEIKQKDIAEKRSLFDAPKKKKPNEVRVIKSLHELKQLSKQNKK